MRLPIIGLLTIVLLTFTSCTKNDSKVADINSDAQLIEAIQKAKNKEIISITELPSSSQKIISEEYFEDYVDAAKHAPKLGYEVQLRCEKGLYVGEHSLAYFDLTGRKLLTEEEEVGDKPERKKCFTLVLPVTFTMPDDSEITVSEKEDWALIKAWYADHPDSQQKPEIQFPVDIRFIDGTVKTINDETGMRRAVKFCNDQEGDDINKCFRMLYPITYAMSDSSEVTIKSEEAHKRLRLWYSEHPDVEKPTLKFPVKIKFIDGTIKTINNIEEMKKAKEACEGEDKP